MFATAVASTRLKILVKARAKAEDVAKAKGTARTRARDVVDMEGGLSDHQPICGRAAMHKAASMLSGIHILSELTMIAVTRKTLE